MRDPNPPQLTYIRSMPFEHAVETVQSGGVKLTFAFDRAYWMSNLTPVDEHSGVARVDARSFAIPDRPHSLTPEAGGPATTDQTGPYTMTGQAWTTRSRSQTRPRTLYSSRPKATMAISTSE